MAKPQLGLESKQFHNGQPARIKVFGDKLDTGKNKPGFKVNVELRSTNHQWTPRTHSNVPNGQRDKYFIWVDATPTRTRSAKRGRSDDDLTVTVAFDDNGVVDQEVVDFCHIDVATVALATKSINQQPTATKKSTAKKTVKKPAKKKSAKPPKAKKSRK